MNLSISLYFYLVVNCELYISAFIIEIKRRLPQTIEHWEDLVLKCSTFCNFITLRTFRKIHYPCRTLNLLLNIT